MYFECGVDGISALSSRCKKCHFFKKEKAAIGRMPDSIEENPAAEIVEKFDKLLGEVKTPLTQEEVKILINLFPKSTMYEVEWTLLHLVETYLIETPSRSTEYRQLIAMCSSDEWRGTLQVRLGNWEKKR